MTRTFHLIGCASGVAGADAHSGDGPVVLQQSPYLSASGLPITWDEMLQPTESDLRVDESLGNLFTTLAQKTSLLVRQGVPFSVIGGDHSCAIGTWSGVYDAYEKKGDIGLIWVDAHMDSHTPETSPSNRIHGMPLAVLLGYGYPTLTNILHSNPKFKPENVCLIGVRSFEEGEAALLKRLNVRIYFMEEVAERGFEAVLQEAVAHVSRNTVGYGLTLDMDAIDPEDAPGVDVPETNGISASAIRGGLSSIANDKRLIATEVVEFDPLRDKEQKTEKLMADIVTIMAKGKLG